MNLVLLFFAFAVLWSFHGNTWQDKQQHILKFKVHAQLGARYKVYSCEQYYTLSNKISHHQQLHRHRCNIKLLWRQFIKKSWITFCHKWNNKYSQENVDLFCLPTAGLDQTCECSTNKTIWTFDHRSESMSADIAIHFLSKLPGWDINKDDKRKNKQNKNCVWYIIL